MKFEGGVRRIASTSHKDNDFNTMSMSNQEFEHVITAGLWTHAYVFHEWLGTE